MTDWLTTREAVKRALGAAGTDLHPTIDRHIAAASHELQESINRKFIPRTATYYFDGKGKRSLWLPPSEEGDLLAVTTLKVDENGDGTYEKTLAANTDYWLWPDNGTPKNRIDINPESAQLSVFPQGRRRVEIVGRFAYSEDTKAAGSVSSGLTPGTSATNFVCSNAALIDVGDTLLIESEQLFVSERTATSLGIAGLLISGIAADVSATELEIATPGVAIVGEVLLVDSERMLVVDTPGASAFVIVQRAYDGSTLASHASAAQAYTYRSLTVVRGVNGTTAAAHPDGTAIRKYVVPEDIERQVRAEAIYGIKADQSGQTGLVGGGDSAQRVNSWPLRNQRQAVISRYRVPVV